MTSPAVREKVRRVAAAGCLQWIAEDERGVTLRYPTDAGGTWFRFDWRAGDTPRTVHRRLYDALLEPVAPPDGAAEMVAAYRRERSGEPLERFLAA